MRRFALLIPMFLAPPLGLPGAQFALSMPLNGTTSAGVASDDALSAFAARRGGNVNRGRTANRNVSRNVNRNVNVNINRNVDVNRAVVGRRYGPGIWYGTGRRFWRGQWYAYGVGRCWARTSVGYVWICR
jgi:hypothetical protein